MDNLDTKIADRSQGRSPELPGQLGSIFLRIEDEVVSLHAEWGVYDQLFREDEDWNLLVQSSPFAWPVLHDALIERCILRITRLTDPSKSTLSFKSLVRVLKATEHLDLKNDLNNELDILKGVVNPLKTLRNQALAHNANCSMLSQTRYPMVSIRNVDESVSRISRLCNAVRKHFNLDHYSYDMCVGAWARDLLEHHKKLQRLENICDRIRQGELTEDNELRRAILNARREQADT